MKLLSQRELNATREKLRLREQRYDAIQAQSADDEHVQKLTLRSLKKLINQLTEEIARFEGHATTK
ncbi:MAG: hypothetical protein HQ567_25170 [Candidatus Nealsonbacteria bacterium]|nr:hypothetical protein [Candidatus Nealsonbacteria bacterium]